MLNLTQIKPLYFNKHLRDYCIKTINDSIRKLPEISNLEQINPKYKKILDKNDNPKPAKLNFYAFLIFLSISSISFYFYKKRLK